MNIQGEKMYTAIATVTGTLDSENWTRVFNNAIRPNAEEIVRITLEGFIPVVVFEPSAQATGIVGEAGWRGEPVFPLPGRARLGRNAEDVVAVGRDFPIMVYYQAIACVVCMSLWWAKPALEEWEGLEEDEIPVFKRADIISIKYSGSPEFSQIN